MKIKSNTSLSLRKFLLSALVAAPLATLPAPLWALPQTTGNVTSNSATTTFSPAAPTTVLNISDPVATRLVLRWVDFGFGASTINNGETVIWNLPSSSSAVLNTITGTGSTTVNGALQSNGSIFILNPNGIIMGPTATVTAAGFGASTISEPEFFFVNNGNLSYSPSTPATTDVAVNGSTINVGTTGSVFLAGRSVDVSGTITAGTLNLTSNNATLGTGVRLGQTGALTLGVAGTAATLLDPAVPGTGDLVINSFGGPVSLSNNAVSILGGDATITTVATNITGGAITQAAGTFSVGDGISNSNLTLNTGTGAVTLSSLSGNGLRNNVTLTTGITSITSAQRIGLNASTVTGNLTIVATTGPIDSIGDVTVTGGTIALTTLAANQAIVFKGPGDLTFTTLSTAGGTGGPVTVTSTTGAVSLPAATIRGNLTVTAQTNITQTGALDINDTGRVASFDAVTGSVTLTNAANDFTRVQIKNSPSGANIVDANAVVIANATTATGAVTIATLGGNITFGAGDDETTRFGNNLTLIAGSPTPAVGTITAAGSGYTQATTTAIVSPPDVPTGTAATATVTITAGAITAVAVTAGSGYTRPPTVTIVDSAAVPGTGGAVTIALGAASTISDANNNNTVIGALNLNAAGAITLNGATANTVGLNNQFGQVNATSAGLLTVYESTTLNLGTINTGVGGLRAYGVAGLIQSGSLTTSGPVALGAGTGAAPGDIALTNTGNNITGTISFLDDFGILNNTGPNGAVIGNYLARNVTILNSAATTTLGAINGTAENGLTGNLTVTSTGALGAITSAGSRINVSGAGGVTLTAPGAVTFTNTSSSVSRVTVTAGGNVDFKSGSNMTVNATLTQNIAGNTATFQSGGAITIGAFTSDYTGTVRFNVTAANRNIVDSVNGIRIFGPVQFAGASGVTVNRANHSFGGVTIATGNNGSATIVESGGLRLVDVNINGSGSFTATSTTGDILQDSSNVVLGSAITGGIRFTNGNSSATFTAPLGRVLLTDGRNNFAGRVNVTAAGDVVITNARDTILGNITTMGKLTVDKSGSPLFVGVNLALATGGTGYTSTPTVNISAPNLVGGTQATATANRDTVATSATFQQITSITINNPGSGYTTAPVITITGGGATVDATVLTSVNNSDISQFAGSRLNVFDTVTLRTSAVGSGAINVGNTGNRMGGVIASSGTGTITLSEESTLNLKSINTLGSLNATSEANNIIDSTDANIVSTGTLGNAAIANSIVVGNTAAFTAPNGSATLSLGASNYNIVGFTTGGNASVLDTIGNTTLGTSTIGGSLDVTNTTAPVAGPPIVPAVLNQSGAVKVQGNTTFTTNQGTIDLGNSANEFGGLRFTGNTVAITENTTMNLRGGSVANGPAILNTNGNFITSGVGGSSFIGTLTINAPNGSITPGAGSLLVVGTFTVFSNVLKDLSALSKSGNLTNKDPINLGTGTYVPPGP